VNIAESWPEDVGDSCGNFFGQLLKAASPDLPADAHVLEIGCDEFDWLEVASRVWPEMSFMGIDTRLESTGRRGTNVERRKWDAMQTGLFAPQSFDLIVGVSSIEHIGLGHYGDPVDGEGDTKALANAFRWLKVGGWLLFDVPYTTDEYRVVTTSHREYDWDAIWSRLWVEPLARAKASARWQTEVYAPSGETKQVGPRPEKTWHFWYAGFGWQRVW